jgi:hypothetical protein
MSLPNKISQAVFVIDPTGTPDTHTLTVSNLRIPTSISFYEGRQGLSIGGKRRSKNIIRGFDRSMSFDWESVSNQETEILAFLDALKDASDNDYDIRFNAYGETDYIFVVPEEAVFNENYINQIKRTPTKMEFLLAEIRSDTGYD